MNRAIHIVLGTGAALLLTSSIAIAAKSGGPGQKPVMKVDAASVEVIRMPHAIRVCARGWVNTSGWSNPTLTPRVYVAPPKDGMWEVDFRATPPTKIVSQVVTPIWAEKVWSDYPEKSLKGVTVVSANNRVSARLGAAGSACGPARPARK